VCAASRGRRVWPCNGTRARPTDSELLMHLVATFLDFRHRSLLFIRAKSFVVFGFSPFSLGASDDTDLTET
jgi:hypothetical protein